MPREIDPRTVAELLPGTWRIGGTNLPRLLSGERRLATVTYRVVSRQPLRVGHVLSFVDPSGRDRRLPGVSRARAHGFAGRNKGMVMPFSLRWSVCGVSEDRAIVVVRFARTRAAVAGIEVLVRIESELQDLRGAVAAAALELGLSLEDFARLTWFDAEAGLAHDRSDRPPA
jgi:hypothetical protein